MRSVFVEGDKFWGRAEAGRLNGNGWWTGDEL